MGSFLLGEGSKKAVKFAWEPAVLEESSKKQPRMTRGSSVGRLVSFIDENVSDFDEEPTDDEDDNDNEQFPNSGPVVAERQGPDRWTVKSIYEWEVLQHGMGTLLRHWQDVGYTTCPPPRGWRFAMSRGVLESLANGVRELKAVPRMEIAQAQPDVRKMPVELLLPLRLQLAGVRQGSLGEVVDTFVAAVDSCLFSLLGTLALDRLSDSTDATKLLHHGREALFMVALSTAIPGSKMWSWLTDVGERRFFDGLGFQSTDLFPAHGGALEFRDLVSACASDFLGRQRLIHWQIWRVYEEDDLEDLSEASRRKCQAEAGVQISSDAIRHGRAGLRRVTDRAHRVSLRTLGDRTALD